MSSDEQLRSDAERNRRLVLEIATELLSRDPQASLQEIADACGIGRTTIYRHFPNRENLLEAVTAAIIDTARVETMAAVADPDPEIAIRGLGAASIDLALRYGRLFADRDGQSATYEAFKVDDTSPARRFLTTARERGAIRADMPVEWLRSVIQAVTFTAINEVDAGTSSIEEAVQLDGDTLVAVLLTG